MNKKRFLIHGILYLALTILNPLYTSGAEDTFSNIFELGYWGRNEEGEAHCGSGSTLCNGAVYVHYIEDFIRTHQIKSVVDLGCGDWELMRNVDWQDTDYLGIEVVPALVEKNISRYGRSNIHFIAGDAMLMELPSADLLLCKDVLQHLPNEYAMRLIRQISKYKYAIITNDVDPVTMSCNNCEIEAIGNYRPIDLTRPPYNVSGTKVVTYLSDTNMKQMLLIKNN